MAVCKVQVEVRTDRPLSNRVACQVKPHSPEDRHVLHLCVPALEGAPRQIRVVVPLMALAGIEQVPEDLEAHPCCQG
jgi:hypothetical protein